MHNLQNILLKNLQKQKLIRISSASLSINLINNFLNTKVKWIEKNNILYIKNLNPDQKFKLYLGKKQLIEIINQKFEKLWIKKRIKDIRIL
jgi:hypothetical protein